MFTRIQLATNQTIAAGSKVVGKSSGTQGYIVDAITSANHLDVYEIEGSFQTGEMITLMVLIKIPSQKYMSIDYLMPDNLLPEMKVLV